jgi:hypothetical protein
MSSFLLLPPLMLEAPSDAMPPLPPPCHARHVHAMPLPLFAVFRYFRPEAAAILMPADAIFTPFSMMRHFVFDDIFVLLSIFMFFLQIFSSHID